MGRSIRLVVVALVMALAVAACGGKQEEAPQAAAPNASSPQVVDDGTLAAGEEISSPKGEVVLTVSGDIGAANKGRTLELDLASLEQMRQVRLEAAEPSLRPDPDSVPRQLQPRPQPGPVDLERHHHEGRVGAGACPTSSAGPGARSSSPSGGAGRAHHGRRGADPALHGTQVRRALLGNQLYLLEGMGGDDAAVAATVGAVERDLRPIDRALARAKADPSHASLTAEAERMRPAIRRITVRVKELYDAKEQGFFGAYATLTAEVDERKAAERALRASEERFRALVQNSSDVISIVDADGGVRYHSESVRRVLGYDPAELVDGDPPTWSTPTT